jgi:crossover junction endodeoxyribonuclease RusA
MKIILSGAPQSTNNLYRHSCAGGRPIVYMTKEGKALKTDYAWQAHAQWRRPMFDGELIVEITLFFPDNRRRDIDNYSKILLDALTGIVWKDDSQIVRATVEKKVDVKNPRIEILIK